MSKENYEIVVFNDDDLSLEVKIDSNKETVWLTQKQMSELFKVSIDNISLHIKNIYQEKELEFSTFEEYSIVQIEGKRKVQRNIKLYNLDVIISVGYRVKSQRGILFRRWANKVLKKYLIEGYAINDKRLEILNKTIEIQTKMLSTTLEIDNNELLNVINEYTNALTLLEEYDHKKINKPKGNETIYRLTYKECRELIDNMQYDSTIFGVEKEKGKLEGIIDAIYQSAFGVDAYESAEEKAANLLYFFIKDHPFIDGCKRIGVAIFLLFLSKNNILRKKDKLVINNSSLVALTLLVSESNPNEKDIIIKLIMNLLTNFEKN